MQQKLFFTPGPSQLYPGVETFLRSACESHIGSISHRSQAFKDIYKNTCEQLRELIQLPSNYHILFLSSATECWERLFNNCVSQKSFHFVNGAFSKKFYDFGLASRIDSQKYEVEAFHGFESSSIPIDEHVELLAFTHNETSTGVVTPFDYIYTFHNNYPEALIAVDVVSSLPYPHIDFTKIDSAFFSVQKCFGLPSGLGVWLVNERCLNKAQEKSLQNPLGAHHTLPELIQRSESYQTPCTPNILGIYLLGQVCAAMLHKGLDKIREETDYKANLLYEFIHQHDLFNSPIENTAHRSKTVIVSDTQTASKTIHEYLEQHLFFVGSGYGRKKASQIRIANFPAHSIESTEKLIALLKKI